MIQEDIFEHLSSCDYSSIQSEIQNGDLLLCSGNGLISELIQKATGSIFSHVGLILSLPVTHQWLVVECIESLGVRCVTLLEGYLKNYQDSGKGYDGRIMIARHTEFEKNFAYIESLYERAFSLMGDKYSREDVFHIASRIALNKIGIHENGLIKENNRYICSEYVYACFKAMKINLPYNPLGFIAPADIAQNRHVKPVCQLTLNPVQQAEKELI
jgi:hypothetical protein